MTLNYNQMDENFISDEFRVSNDTINRYITNTKFISFMLKKHRQNENHRISRGNLYFIYKDYVYDKMPIFENDCILYGRYTDKRIPDTEFGLMINTKELMIGIIEFNDDYYFKANDATIEELAIYIDKHNYF